ncbi:hypothetical protein [Sphingomonas sp. 3-13AW]|uniref:hypothetical protein n=1 Tax=Sphingomonas sp. 3-13AW TaxID=3050450 RepID=UPI003BB58CB0
MPVQKLVLQFTVMCATDTLEEAVSAYADMELSEIEESISVGEDIGSGIKIISSETLSFPEQVTKELIEIGNDGSFFDCELGRLVDLEDRADATDKPGEA